MKVLFCTDGSKISYGAVVNFSKWFNNFNTDILTVADWSCLSDNLLSEYSIIQNKCANNADSILNYTQEFLLNNDINFNQKIKSCGSVVDAVLEKEKEEDYSYIIVGSNGKKGLQKWLGSVSYDISSFSDTSVYISKNSISSDRVAFALDSSLISSKRFMQTLKNINLQGKEIHLLTVYEIPDYLFLEGNIDSNWVIDINEKQNREGMIILSKNEEIFKDLGCNNCIKRVLSGNCAKEIVRYCADNEIGLVVCGMRNRKYLSKLIPGSISRRILEDTKSDVLIMK